MKITKSSLNNLIVSLLFTGTIIIPNNKLPYNEFLKYRDKVFAEYTIKKADNKADTLIQKVEKKINFIFNRFPELTKGWYESKKEEKHPYFEIYLLNRGEFNRREGFLFSNMLEKSVRGEPMDESFAINKHRDIDDFELTATLVYFLSQYSSNIIVKQNYFFVYLVPLHLGYKPPSKIEYTLKDEDKIIYALYFLAGEKFLKSAFSSFSPELEKIIDEKLGKGAYSKMVKFYFPFGVDFEKTEQLLKKAGLFNDFEKSFNKFLNNYFKITEE